MSSVIVSSGDWDAKCMKNPLSCVDEHMGEVGAGRRKWLISDLGVEVGLFMGGRGWREE